MDNKERYIHEIYASMAERTIKRLWVLCIIMFLALVGSNIAWLYYESQFTDEQTTTVTQELDSNYGDAIINDGVHINGTGETNYNYN